MPAATGAAAASATPNRFAISSSRVILWFDADSVLPQFLAGEVGALAHRLELLPHHAVMDFGPIQRLRGEAAIGCRDYVVAADQAGEAQNAFADQFGMFDDIAGMCHHAGAKHFAVRDLHRLEQMIFVFMPWICGFATVIAPIFLQ